MLKFLHDLVLFYQTETAFKIFGTILMLAFLTILLVDSLHEKTKRTHGRFDNCVLRKYHLAQARLIMIFLCCGGSQAITHAVCFHGSEVAMPLLVGIANIVLSQIALVSLILLETGIAASIYAATNFTLVALLDSFITDYQALNAISLGTWIITTAFIGICYFELGDVSAQQYLHIKTTNDLEETAS